MTIKIQTFAAAVSAFTALLSAPASAGIFSWVDDAFTFREEQRPLVTPARALPPKVVIEPGLDRALQAAGSSIYTNSQLQATPYMAGSASMVMRAGQYSNAHQQRPNTGTGNAQGSVHQVQQFQQAQMPQQTYNNVMPQQGYGNQPMPQNMNQQGTMIGAPAPMPHGQQPAQTGGMQHNAYPHPNHQLASMEAQHNQRLHVGAPGSGPGMTSGSTSVGAGVHIGDPKRSLSYRPDAVTPRRGDYDYGVHTQGRATYSSDVLGATTTGRDTAYGNATTVYPHHAATNTTYAPSGQAYHGTKPNQYTVQSGDTLSTISDKDQIYGNWKLWPLIYDANRGLISNPDHIHRNDRLDIPRDYSQQDARDATRRAIMHHSR